MADEWTPGRQLKRWRGDRTAAEVAAALGVTTQTLSNWETNRFQPHISKSAAIEELYGLQRGMVAALLQGEKPPADLIDPQAVGIRDGSLVWSAQQIQVDDGVRDWPQNATLTYGHGSIAADGIRNDPSLEAGQRETLLRILDSFQFENRTRGVLRPAPDPEPEGP